MTPLPPSGSPEAGGTDAVAGPQALAGPVRFLPPTAAEVGRAAALCFQDAQSDEQIARQFGIVRRTLARWKRRADFAAALAALQAWQELVGEEGGSLETAPPPRRRGGGISRKVEVRGSRSVG